MVAIKAHEADRALARLDPAWRVILLYGPDAGLIAERARALSRAAVADPDDPFQLVRLDGDALVADPARLVDEANTIGLFSAHKALRISPAAKSILQAVEPVLKAPPAETLVIVEAGDLQRQNALRQACERSPAALAIPCFGDSDRDLETLVDRMMTDAGKSMDRKTRAALVAALGNDRLVSRREIEKLLVYIGSESVVRAEDIVAIIGENNAQELDALVDAVFSGNRRHLDPILAKLAAAGVDGNAILASLLRHGLGLMRCRSALDAGRSPKEAAGLMRGLPYPRMATAEATVRAWTLQGLTEAVLLIGQTTASLRRDGYLGRAILMRALWNITGKVTTGRPISP